MTWSSQGSGRLLHRRVNVSLDVETQTSEPCLEEECVHDLGMGGTGGGTC